jgi:flagellar motility protein MotE (MotC chaperone)
MTVLEKIEQQIAALDPKDVRKLGDWLDEYRAELWDKQIEADAKAGKLDKLVADAKAQAAAGKLRPL